MAEVKPTSTDDLTKNAEQTIADNKQAQLDAVAAQEAKDKIPPSPTQEENDRVALGLPVELADPGEAEGDDAAKAKRAADKKATADKAAADKAASEKSQAASGDAATYKTRNAEGN